MRTVVMEGFGQVEDDIRRARLELLDDRRDVIENRQRFHLMPQALETIEHARFGGLLMFPQRLGRKLLFRIGSLRDIEQNQNLHAYTDLLNLPVYK